MYKLNLSKVFSTPGCKTEFQIGDSYCAWSKLAKVALGIDQICTSPCYAELGIGHITEEAQRFFLNVIDAIGKEKFEEVTNLNDSPGSMADTHEIAVRLGIEYGVLAGIFQLELDDSQEKEEVDEHQTSRR